MTLAGNLLNDGAILLRYEITKAVGPQLSPTGQFQHLDLQQLSAYDELLATVPAEEAG